MVSFRFRKWICGTSLKTATIIIGVLCITFGLIGLYALVISGDRAKYKNSGLSKSSLMTFGVVTLLGAVPVGILYIYGAIKRHRKIILVGLLIHFAVAVISGLLILIATAAGSKYTDDDGLLHTPNKSYRIFNIFFGISLLTIFGAYFLLVVNSFRMQLKVESPKPNQPLHISVSEPSSKTKVTKTPPEGTYDTQVQNSQIPSERPQVQDDSIRIASYKDTIMTQFLDTQKQGGQAPGDTPFTPLYLEASEQSEDEERSPLISESVSLYQSQLTQTPSSSDAPEPSEDEEETPRIAEQVSSRQSKLTQTSSTSVFQRGT